MKFNAYCTIWLKQSDGTYSSVVYPCWWQSTEAENISKTEKTDVDKAMIHLPISATVEMNNYIAKGNIAFEVKGSVTELLKAVKPFKVSTIERKDYGSENVQHIEVTAK